MAVQVNAITPMCYSAIACYSSCLNHCAPDAAQRESRVVCEMPVHDMPIIRRVLAHGGDNHPIFEAYLSYFVGLEKLWQSVFLSGVTVLITHGCCVFASFVQILFDLA